MESLQRHCSISLSADQQHRHHDHDHDQEQEYESSVIVTTLKQETGTVDDTSTPILDSSFNGLDNKEANYSSHDESDSYLSIRENQELGFASGAKEIKKKLDSVKEEAKVCDLVSGSSGADVMGEDFGRKVQNFVGEVHEMQYPEMGFVSDVEGKQEAFDAVNRGKEDSVKSRVEFSGIQEFDKLKKEASAIENKKCVVEIEVGSVIEKDLMITSSEVADKNQKLSGKDVELDSFLEAKKKQLLEELRLIPVVEKVSDSEISGGVFGVSTLIRSMESEARNANCGGKESGGEGEHKMGQNGAEKKDAFKRIDGSVGCSLKVEVIDDTALIETIPVLKRGNGRGKETGFVGSSKDLERNVKKNENMEVDGKKVKRPGRRGKGVKKVLETNEKAISTQMVVAQNGCPKNEDGTKKMYSKSEMESLRFFNIAEQRKKWKEVYNGLGPTDKRLYDDLVSRKHEKHTHLKFDPQKLFEKKADTPAILSDVCSGNVDNKLENMETNETEDVDPSDPALNQSVRGEGGYTVSGECSEDDDSDEDYASIQRPAFLVEGEPNFDSGSPEDGLEYLRRVRWEAARIPKVKVAKVDRSKFNKEQSAYMPKIPDIAKCPEHLLPLKQWEDSFLADFSELRLVLSRLGGFSAEVSGELQLIFINHELNYSHQLPERTVLENVDNHDVDCCSVENLLDQQSLTVEDYDTLTPVENSSPKLSVNDSCDNYPTLSGILGMDSVARVSMLRKRISSLESSSTLSRNDCVWFFALCAAVDTPLGADTCAALRSLLRKCASLRAEKSELDDEVIMLNILATISGRYFGQSGSGRFTDH